MNDKPKLSIGELEGMLPDEGEQLIEILPNGDVVRKGTTERVEPVTKHRNIGGSY